MSNELRERVVLRVDGGMRSGRDVLVSAALGGDEYGFGTVAMIATGCIMVRPCLAVARSPMATAVKSFPAFAVASVYGALFFGHWKNTTSVVGDCVASASPWHFETADGNGVW